MVLEIVHTEQAPKAIGPYSQAIIVGDLLYTSGQIPVIPDTGELAGLDIEVQTAQALKNIEAILRSKGIGLKNVVKTTVFMKNLGDFTRMNGVYEKHFEGHKPARSTIEISRLPKDSLVEIECIASLK